MHESGHKIVPTQPHIRSGDFRVTCSVELSKNLQDVNKMSDG